MRSDAKRVKKSAEGVELIEDIFTPVQGGGKAAKERGGARPHANIAGDKGGGYTLFFGTADSKGL